MRINTLLVSSLVLTSGAFAQDAVVSVSAPASADVLTLVEQASVYVHSDSASTLTAFDTTILAHLIGLDWHVTLPVYTSDVSGYGALDLGVSWDFLTGGNMLGATTKLTVAGGALMPTGSAGYETTEVTPYFGGGVSMNWGKVSFVQTANYTFVTGSTFNPLAGTLSENTLALTSNLGYDVSDTFVVGLNLTQEYFSGGNVAVLGPTVDWTIAPSVSVEVGVGFPVWQELAVENTCVVNAGVSFKF